MFKSKVFVVSTLLILLLVASSVSAQTPQLSEAEKEKIYKAEILAFVEKQPAVDWNSIEKQFKEKYGAVAVELVWKAKPDFYRKAKDWTNMYQSLSKYISKYGSETIVPTSLNNYAWTVFLHLGDKKSLQEAADWSLQSVKRQDNHPDAIDTHANILYRLGKIKEAIEWQEKAVAAPVPDAVKKQLQTTLDKMKKGEPTWPVK